MRKQLKTISAQKLWKQLGDIPVNEDGGIKEPFFGFEIGTDREDIWRLIENNFDISIDNNSSHGVSLLLKLADIGKAEFEGPYECPFCHGQLMVDLNSILLVPNIIQKVNDNIHCMYCCEELKLVHFSKLRNEEPVS